MRPSGDIEAVNMKDESENKGKEEPHTMINGNIKPNCAYLGQLPPTILNSHRNVVKFDGSIIVAYANSWLNTTLVCPRQTQGSEQNRVID